MLHESAILSQTTGWIILACLGFGWVAVGIYWGRKAKNLEGYMLAGRNVGLALGAATAMATWVTSNTTMLAPQLALQLGIWGMLAYSTACVGLLLFAPMAKRIRQLMPAGYTSGDFIRLRYGKRTWHLFLIISLFYSMTWLISMGMAGGILLNALAGIPYVYGMTVILTVCVLYTLFGGLYAVIGTDYIQSVIIIVGIVIVAIAILSRVDLHDVHEHLTAHRPGLLTIMLPAALMALFNNLLFGVGEIFHSNVWWSRAFAMGDGIGEKAYLLAGIFWLPIPVVAGFVALCSGVLDINVTSPDMVGPMVAARALGRIGALAVFVVIFCSLASSIDSLLAATSDLITEDLYHKLWNPAADEVKLRKVSAAVIVILGLITWSFCLPRIGTLATVLFFAGPMVGSAIWPIVTGLYWERASPSGAFGGMAAGSLCGLAAYFTLGWYTASLIGAAVSMIVVCVCARLSSHAFHWERLNERKISANSPSSVY